MGQRVRIGVVAPSSFIDPAVPDEVTAFAKARYGGRVELVFDPQCLARHGHFAGTDAERAEGVLRIANDPAIDAVWFARGGYGSCRPAEAILAGLGEAARRKTWMGYSDGGALLAGLYRAGFPHLAHGPLPHDIRRAGGEAAVSRALAWLVDRDPAALDQGLVPGEKVAAFNLTILSQILGTPLEPDLTGHVLMLEEVGEYAYRIDRMMFHLTSNPAIRRVKGIRLGRCYVDDNPTADFAMTAEEIVRFWCERSGIAFLGAADIGHDADNRVVPFGGV
ncbi:MAG: LD-carboxypeptidase [Caulobacter sp.]|nr:LD-carboxypeptidase [Caulobacter sp.]